VDRDKHPFPSGESMIYALPMK
jgi:hypothetical protein